MNMADVSLYDKIRKENIIKYGTHVAVYGPRLLANLYSERTHFVYELLQNAEDACERAKQAGNKKKFTARLDLLRDRLRLTHNGIPFNEDDVVGICGIVEGTKADDRTQIGKFGIGFKSVYAYSKSPEIYSGDKSFCINNYVQPSYIEPDSRGQERDTVIVIPFNHDKVSEEVAFREIAGRLMNLGVTNFLFLKNIEEVEWSTEENHSGVYLKASKALDIHNSRVELLSKIDQSEDFEEWLVFDRPVSETEASKVEVAFKIERTSDGRDYIAPVKGAKLASFFLTEKITWLNFIVQGPYETTPARDNVNFGDEWNKKLITETATLVEEAITRVKEMGLLDVGFQILLTN
jgi:hypothetical protein